MLKLFLFSKIGLLILLGVVVIGFLVPIKQEVGKIPPVVCIGYLSPSHPDKTVRYNLISSGLDKYRKVNTNLSDCGTLVRARLYLW